jgi:hypothetical protein
LTSVKTPPFQASGFRFQVSGLSTPTPNSITNTPQPFLPHVGDRQVREFVDYPLCRHAKFIQKQVPEWQAAAEKPCQNAIGLYRPTSASVNSIFSPFGAFLVFFVIVKGHKGHISL